jgi:hypothetical protein
MSPLSAVPVERLSLASTIARDMKVCMQEKRSLSAKSSSKTLAAGAVAYNSPGLMHLFAIFRVKLVALASDN